MGARRGGGCGVEQITRCKIDIGSAGHNPSEVLMLYLFCSAAAPLYKRDALESISYPSEHIFRFRYAQKYVHQDVLNGLQKFKGKQALLVFLDTVTKSDSPDFVFYPLRTVTILRLEQSAGAIYCDFRFGEFVDYGTNARRRDLWDAFFRKQPSRPWPPGSASDGYFVFAETQEPPELVTESSRPYDNWNSVVNQLDQTNNLKDSTFCLVLGFYQVKRQWACGAKPYEKKLEPTHNEFDSIYPIPMGQSVVLKMLLSRPSFNYSDPKSARTLTISAGGDTFSGMSKSNIDVRSPRLTLLTRVKVPRLVISAVVGGVALSALLLALDAEVVKFLSTFCWDSVQSWLDTNAKSIAAVFKLLSPIPVAFSAYLAFRKLPIK